MSPFHPDLFPSGLDTLPTGFGWIVTRLIHCFPDDTVDGWRATITFRGSPCIEVIHRDRWEAMTIAVDEAGEIYPSQFTKKKKR